MFYAIDYASPSAFDSTATDAQLGFSANRARPVQFDGTIKPSHTMLLRFALRALGEAVWNNEGWRYDEDSLFILDPIITVHPDQIIFEAFSQDESTYARLVIDPAIFDVQGTTSHGTTNIDFSAWLWGALGEMRSSRATRFSIGAGGFAVKTEGAGGRFEQKVEIPDSWVRGLLQVQSAMTLPGTRLMLRPVDLLAAIRFLRYAKGRISPRALRYEMQPGKDARIVLEPWEHVIDCEGADHTYDAPRVIRTWGRQRLKLIEPLLPFADSVGVYLKGRAMPSFYEVRLPGMQFWLGLSGFAGQKFSREMAFDLMPSETSVDGDALDRLMQWLATRFAVSVEEAAERLGTGTAQASRMLNRLSQAGRVLFDPATRQYRHRELFAEPIDMQRYFPPDVKRELARGFVKDKLVQISRFEQIDNIKIKRFKTPDGPIQREVVLRDTLIEGSAADQPQVHITLNDDGQMIFGKCGCAHFKEHLFNRGACEHMQALYLAAQNRIGVAS
jgi:hypothetical protein